MSAQKWLEAAERYRRTEEENSQRILDKFAEFQHKARERYQELKRLSPEIVEAALNLKLFIDSGEGHTAIALLAASNRTIVLGYKSERGYAHIILLDNMGLHWVIEGSGFSTVTEREAIEAAMVWHGKKPAEVLPWLCNELDKIANAAEPRTKAQREERTHAACGNN